MEEKTWTVYCHTNKVNGKIYIGLTCSHNPKRRWRGGAGYYKCPRFYAAVQKYGWNNFTHEVLETGLTEAQASEAERLYISFFDADTKERGYNIQPGGISSGGMSEAGKESLRAHNTGLNANKQRPVVSFDLDGNRLLEFPLISFAAEHYGIRRSTLINHLRKPRGTCHGMIFKYAEDVAGCDHLPSEMLETALSRKSISGSNNYKSKPVAVFDCVSGKRIADFGCVSDAKAFCNGDVQAVLSGRQTTCGGKYICRYAEDVVGIDLLPEHERRDPECATPNRHKNVRQYSRDGVFIAEYYSLADASRATGIGFRAISLCALGKTKTSGGFIWKYF